MVVLSRDVGIVSAEEEGSSGDTSSGGESLQHQHDDVVNEEVSGLAMLGDTAGFGAKESSGWYSASKKDCGPHTVPKQRRPRSLSFSVVKNTSWRANQHRESAPAVPGAGSGGHRTFNYHNLAQNATSLYTDRIHTRPQSCPCRQLGMTQTLCSRKEPALLLETAPVLFLFLLGSVRDPTNSVRMELWLVAATGSLNNKGSSLDRAQRKGKGVQHTHCAKD